MRYEFTNLEDIPDDLEPGVYTTKIIEANWDVIRLEFIGEHYDPAHPQCLVPMVKSNTYDYANLVHPFTD